MVADGCWFFGQIWSIHFLTVGSSLNSFQVDKIMNTEKSLVCTKILFFTLGYMKAFGREGLGKIWVWGVVTKVHSFGMDRSASSCSHWHELDGQEHKKLQSELIDMHRGFVNQHPKYYPWALSVIFMLVRGDYGTAIHLAALRCFSHPLHIWLYGGPFRVYMEPFWILDLLLWNNEGQYMGSHVHWLNPSILIRSNLLVVGVSTVSSMRFMECIVEDYPGVQTWRFRRCLVSKHMHF